MTLFKWHSWVPPNVLSNICLYFGCDIFRHIRKFHIGHPGWPNRRCLISKVLHTTRWYWHEAKLLFLNILTWFQFFEHWFWSGWDFMRSYSVVHFAAWLNLVTVTSYSVKRHSHWSFAPISLLHTLNHLFVLFLISKHLHHGPEPLQIDLFLTIVDE